MDSVIERVEKLGREGVFGNGELKNVQNQSDEEKGSQFASQLFFLQVDLQDTTGKVAKIPVIVKIEPGEKERGGMSTEIQFANEVAMYDKILPELGIKDLGIIPKMFYGLTTQGEEPDEDIIVLEDLRHQDFRVAKDLSLDYDHLTLALRTLGKFHGLSYKMKNSSPETLHTLGKPLQSKMFADPDNLFQRCLMRGFKALLQNPSYSYLEKVFKKLTNIPSKDTWCNLQKPEEPFTAIIHGDFNRNNILFAYDNNQVVSVKFIDFGASLYSDPAIDISFFLYMNTSEELRAVHWDDLLEEYWKGVTSIAVDPGFSYEDFLKNFAKKAIWGYLPCSFFLPMMLFPDELGGTVFDEMSIEEKIDWAENNGGEKATEAVTSVVRHLADKGYMKEFLLNFTNEAQTT